MTPSPAFTADLTEHGQLHAAFVRSPFARARIRAIDTSAVLGRRGVVAVWTGRDLLEAGVRPLPVLQFRDSAHSTSDRGLQHGLAHEEAAYAGQAVAIIVADTAWNAEQSAEQLRVDYEEIRHVLSIEEAEVPGAPAVAGGIDNLAVELRYGDAEEVKRAIQDSAVSSRLAFRHPRHHPISLEPRACLADYRRGRLNMRLSHECPHFVRELYSRMLDVPQSRIRVVARRVGGGFGARRVVSIEEAVIAWAAMRLGRPVRWVSERAEAFLADAHGPDAETIATMGFDESGAITGLSVRCRFNVGARFSTFGGGFGHRLLAGLSASYPIPVLHCAVRGVFTNTAPTDVIDDRGAGEATLILERLIDTGARSLGMDPASLRRRNRVREGHRAMPPGEGNLSSTSTLERVLERVGYGALRDRFGTLSAQGRYTGIGISCYTEPSGSAHGVLPELTPLPLESGIVRVHPDGSASVYAGRASRGEASEKGIAQLVAEQLGATESDVAVVYGDTDASPYEAVFPATGSLKAIEACARSLRSRLIGIAAAHAGVGEDEIEVAEDGGFLAGRGPEARRLTLAELAAAVHEGLVPGAPGPHGLEVSTTVSGIRSGGRNGAHAAVVEIEAETGRVELKRYIAVDEIGLYDDAAELDVRLRGSLMRGISRALWEEARYRSTGGLGSVSMMTYTVPAASRLPEIETEQIRTRTAERADVDPGGTAAEAAIANAVADALSPLGIRHLDMPYTPERVWEAIRRANQGVG